MLSEIIATLLFSLGATEVNTSKEFECLAKNIYFESRNQSSSGQIAVAMVTLNRVKDDRYPNTICGVVTQGYHSKWWKETHNKHVPIKHKCHFSWYCDGLSDRIRDKTAYEHAKKIANSALSISNSNIDPTDGATHYHSKNVDPAWNKQKTYIGTIDDHLFYRWEKN
jgi:spore germination cell wall hydrolase CwlJ-like protein